MKTCFFGLLKWVFILLSIVIFSAPVQGKCFLLKDKSEYLELSFIEKNHKKIIFFASWCSLCGKHLVEEKRTNLLSTLYVASYDTIEAADRVMSALNLKGLCLVDTEGALSKKWKVSSLPYEKIF